MLMRKFQQLGKNEWWRREKAELLNECRHACLNKLVRTQDCSTTERWNRIIPGSIPTHSKRWLGRKMLWKPYLHRRFNRTLKAFNIARVSPTDQPIRCPCDHPELKNNVLVFFLFLLPFLLVLLFSIPLFPLSFLPFLFFCVPSLPPSFIFRGQEQKGLYFFCCNTAPGPLPPVCRLDRRLLNCIYFFF